MTTPIISISNLNKYFGSYHALSEISISINEGEVLTLLGPSGCGKTTLMRLIAGFDTPTEGTISIDGREMGRTPPEKRPVNMVFQRYALFPNLDVFDNVAYGLRVKGKARNEIADSVNRMLDIVQLQPLKNRRIEELSGGQCQRVALARALVNRPKVLLLDEPLAALDLKIRQHMLREMRRIHAETGATFVYVTHDQDEAMVLSDRVCLMDRGRIVQIDTPERMYARPRSLFAAKFLGETNLFDATLEASNTARTVAGLVFTSASECGPIGSSVVVSLRPEALRFVDTSSARITGLVSDVLFMGSRSIVSVLLGDGHEVRVQTQRALSGLVPVIGETVGLDWATDDVAILAA